jgi:hypothetical protein
VQEQLILVNEHDEAVGVEEKITAHLNGALHRAFSVFILTRSASSFYRKGPALNTIPRASGRIRAADIRDRENLSRRHPAEG